jgi:hypothetical protein
LHLIRIWLISAFSRNQSPRESLILHKAAGRPAPHRRAPNDAAATIDGIVAAPARRKCKEICDAQIDHDPDGWRSGNGRRRLHHRACAGPPGDRGVVDVATGAVLVADG